MNALDHHLEHWGFWPVSRIEPWMVWYHTELVTTLLVADHIRKIEVYTDPDRETVVFTEEQRLILELAGYTVKSLNRQKE